MKKIYTICFVLLGLLLLSSCKPEKEVSSIEVIMDKVMYNIEDFSLSDIKIKVNYGDNSNETIPLDKSMISSEDQTRLKTPGYYYIWVNYKGKAAEMEIYLAIVHTVSFGEISQVEVVDGTYVWKPIDPQQEGKIFEGWYLDSALTIMYNFDTAVTSDLKLYPKWYEQSMDTSDFIIEYTYYGYSVVSYLGNDQTIIIPTTYNDGINGSGPVVRIADDLFRENSDLISVTLPNSIQYIGEFAFGYCDSLQTINFPNGLLEIDDYAFYSCTSLQNITLPNTITKINKGTFADCDTLTTVIIPQGVERIENSAFNDCDSLVTISFPQSLIALGEEVFMHCPNIKTISLPNSVTAIGQGAFNECDGLTSITLSNNLQAIDAWTFAYCSSLTSINLPTGITEIGSYAFTEATGITSITLPATVTKIDFGAFEYCTALKTLFIPSSVITITDSIAEGCNELTIYCQTGSKPLGWSEKFNRLDSWGGVVTVVWGYNN